MAFQGNHRTFTIPDLFGTILQHHRTGMLVIASTAHERTFYFEEGEVVFALYNHPDQMLGRVLVREHGVDDELLEFVAGKLGDQEYLGAALEREGVIPPELLDSVLSMQIRRALHEVLLWKEWAFHFLPTPTPANLPVQRLSTQRLVFDVARELDEWEFVEKIFPELDAVPERIPGADPALIPFSLEEGAVEPESLLELIDGSRSVRAVLERSGRALQGAAHALQKLVESAQIRITRSRPTAPRPGSGSMRISTLTIGAQLPARILQLFEFGMPGLDELRRYVAMDPILAVRCLRVAALHGLWDDHTEFRFEDFVRRLRSETLHSLFLAEIARGLYLSNATFDGSAIWQRSYRASLAASELARRSNYTNPDLAHLAALVQDIGRLLLSTMHAGLYREVEELVASGIMTVEQAELRLFHTTHTQVGAQLAEAWDFPPAVSNVIRHHHDRDPQQDDRLLDVIRLANDLVAQDLPGPRELTEDTRQQLAERLELTPACLAEVRRRVADGLATSPAHSEQTVEV